MTAIHADPAIEGFLALLEKGVVSGSQVSTLPQGLAEAMLATIQRPVDLSQDIEGDVAL
nr:hypothetical protein [uncultured Albidiferax sp.]